MHDVILSPIISWKYGHNATRYVSIKEATIHHYRSSAGLDIHVEIANNCSTSDDLLPTVYAEKILRSDLYKALRLEGYLEPTHTQFKVHTAPKHTLAYNVSAAGSGTIHIPAGTSSQE